MVKINGRLIVTERYPNGETNVKDFDKYVYTDGRKNIVEFKFITDADLILLFFVKKAIDEIRVPCTLFIWYMPYSRMDRKIEGDLFTLKYVADLINYLKFDEVIVMEPHSYVTAEKLKNVKPIYLMKDWIEDVKKEIGFVEAIDTIVYPDKGVALRYRESNYKNICVMQKKRNPFTGRLEKMQMVEGIVNKGAKCIIIDDLCSKGMTFLEVANILLSKGASKVYLVVAHCEENIFNGKLLKEESPIEKIFTSGSMMSKAHPKIEYMRVSVRKYTEV